MWSFQYPIQIQAVGERVKNRAPQGVLAWLEQGVRYEVNQFAIRYLHLPEEERPKYYQAMRSEKEWYGRFKKYLSRKNRIIYHASALGEAAFCKAAMMLAK